MRIKSERDFWSGLMFVAVGVTLAIGATRYSMGPACAPEDPCAGDLHERWLQLSAQPGAGYLPFGLSILLAAVGAVVLFKSLTFESVGGDPVGAFAWRPLVAVLAVVAGFGALVEPAGLIPAVLLAALAVRLAGDGFRSRSTVVGAALLAIAAWATCVWVLHPAIPLWPRFAG